MEISFRKPNGLFYLLYKLVVFTEGDANQILTFLQKELMETDTPPTGQLVLETEEQALLQESNRGREGGVLFKAGCLFPSLLVLFIVFYCLYLASNKQLHSILG